MPKYFVHCTDQTLIDLILTDKIIKTGNSISTSYIGMGESDVVYFSFYIPKKWTKCNDEQRACIRLSIREVIKKYKYYFISSGWDYGQSMEKISSKLHQMVQSATDYSDLERIIRDNNQMTKQCKWSLLNPERLKQLWKFKNTTNLTIREYINSFLVFGNGEHCEICFFDNIDFNNMSYKIIRGSPL